MPALCDWAIDGAGAMVQCATHASIRDISASHHGLALAPHFGAVGWITLAGYSKRRAVGAYSLDDVRERIAWYSCAASQ